MSLTTDNLYCRGCGKSPDLCSCQSNASLCDVAVPANAMTFSAGKITQLAAGDASKPAPISMLAVSGAVLDHWWWGPIILDPAGCTPRQERIPIDWQHDYEDSIGYLDTFTADGATLTVSGQLVPYPADPEDITTKVLAKAAAGVPYQASVDFSERLLGDLQLEYVPDGYLTTVGGQELSGPLTVLRKWPLNAVALCTHGYDAHTSAQLAAGSAERTVTLSLPKELAMLTATAGKSPATPPAADAAASAGKDQLSADKPTQAAATEAPKVEPNATAQLSCTPEQLKAWTEEFGAEQALQILSGAKSVEQARKDQLTALTQQNTQLASKVTELENRLKAAKVGDIEKLSPNPESAPGQPDAAATGDNIDQLTASIEARMKPATK